VTWTKLLASRDVQRHRTSNKELDDIRALIARDRAGAGVTALSADRRFRDGVQRGATHRTHGDCLRWLPRSRQDGSSQGRTARRHHPPPSRMTSSWRRARESSSQKRPRLANAPPPPHHAAVSDARHAASPVEVPARRTEATLVSREFETLILEPVSASRDAGRVFPAESNLPGYGIAPKHSGKPARPPWYEPRTCGDAPV
jgi:hypothetical protein